MGAGETARANALSGLNRCTSTVFAIARELGIPVRFVGTGEGLEDMAEFDALAFVEGLLSSTLPQVLKPAGG